MGLATIRSSISLNNPLVLTTSIAVTDWISGWLLAAPKKRTTRAKKVIKDQF
jgi:hypothetical protein